MIGYLTIAGFLVAFCMVANRLSRTVLTAPMVFLGFGALVAKWNILPAEGSEEALHVIAEIALIVLLFLDAAKIDQSALLKRRVWPVRMLFIGMPLAFLLGTALGLLVLPGWPLALVAVAAAILIPTDAALGQSVVNNPDVPERPRRALTVESGLNDGLALPLVLLMAALAAPVAQAPPEGWALFALKQITLGPLAGIVIGSVGAVALLKAKAAGTTSDTYEGIGALALAASAYTAAIVVGGNGFIAAFAAGLGFGAIVRGRCKFVLEFTEGDGQLLSWGAFFLLGAVLVPEAVAHLTVETLAYILGSLFIVRPLAIWLSLIGSDAASHTRLFFGWFGPRGLATALFALLVAEQLTPDAAQDILFLAVNAVWISAVLHGLTAAPGARLYARRIKRMAPEAEMARMPEPFGDMPMTAERKQ